MFSDKGLTHDQYMEMALRQAAKAFKLDEVPVGAVVVNHNTIIGRGYNQRETLKDPTAHAETLVIRAACAAAGSERLPDHDLYVTLEPCPMCAAVISFARIRRLYYGASDPKSGGTAHGARVFSHPQCHHVPEIYDGIAAAEAETLLKTFFGKKR